jgi:thymidylate kinase
LKLICITGIDGAGTSTLARSLAATLEHAGIKAQYQYGRIVPVISRILMSLGRFFFLRRQDPWKDYASYTVDKKQTMKNPILRLAYVAAVLFDFFVQIWIRLLPPLIRGQIVVLDRYFYDTVIGDLSVHLELSQQQTVHFIDSMFHFVPVPLFTALLDLPEEVAFLRKTDVPHIDYLRERRSYFQSLQGRKEVHLLDSEQSQQRLLELLCGISGILEK